MPNMQEHVVRGWLQNVSLGYRNAKYVASEVFPKILLPTSQAKLWKYTTGEQFLDEAKPRARGTYAAEVTRSGSAVNVDTTQFADRTKVTEEDLRDVGYLNMAYPPNDLKQDAIEYVADKLDLHQEIVVADAIIAATWADGAAGGEDANGLWAEQGSTNTFVKDISNGVATIDSKGVEVDTGLCLLIDGMTWDKLVVADELIERVKYTGGMEKKVTQKAVASMCGLDKVIVARAKKNTAKEGATATIYQIWEKNAGKGMGFLFRYPKKIGLKMQAAGAQPINKSPNGQARYSKTWKEEGAGAWWYHSQEEIGVKQLDANCAYLWNDTYVT